jgi:hypothetical protein
MRQVYVLERYNDQGRSFLGQWVSFWIRGAKHVTKHTFNLFSTLHSAFAVAKISKFKSILLLFLLYYWYCRYGIGCFVSLLRSTTGPRNTL